MQHCCAWEYLKQIVLSSFCGLSDTQCSSSKRYRDHFRNQTELLKAHRAKPIRNFMEEKALGRIHKLKWTTARFLPSAQTPLVLHTASKCPDFLPKCRFLKPKIRFYEHPCATRALIPPNPCFHGAWWSLLFIFKSQPGPGKPELTFHISLGLLFLSWDPSQLSQENLFYHYFKKYKFNPIPFHQAIQRRLLQTITWGRAR